MIHFTRSTRYAILAAIVTLGASAQITFPPDITISRVEVLQSTQDQDHTVALVSGKATAVRAFIGQEGRPEAIITNISAVVRGFRDGVELPLSPLRPVNPAIAARLEPDRANINHSQNFILPMAWTQAGRLELRAEVRLPAGAVEAPAGNNTTTRTVEFVQPVSIDPRISWIPVCINGRCPRGGFQYQRLTERLFPFSDGTLRYEDVPAPPLIWTASPEDEGLPATLEKWRLLMGDTGSAPHVLIGWLPGSASASPAAYSGGAIVLAERPDPFSNELLLARALARGYTNPIDDPCSAFILDPGFDPISARFMPGNRVEFTSTCANSTSWISTSLSRYLAATLTQFRPATESSDSRLVLSGSIRADGSGSMDPALRLSSRVPLTPVNSDGDSVIRVTSSSGSQEHRFNLGARFAVSVPYSGTVSSIALIRNGVEIAALSSSGAAPSISLSELGGTCEATCTLSWIAADPSSRNITYTVLYSADDGTSWVPLATDLTAGGLSVETAALNGPRVLFKVIASAGLDQTEAISTPVTLSQSPLLEVPVPSFDFGSITLGQIAEKGVVVRNAGNGPLQLSSLSVSKDVFQTAARTPVRVRPGTEMALSLRYQPRVSGPDTATLTVSSTDPNSPSTAISLRASVFDRPVSNGVLAPLTLDFGDTTLGQSSEGTLAIRNEGTAPLSITNITVVNPRFSVMSPLGAFTLEPGESRNIVARFLPIAVGPQSGSIVVASNDPSNPSIRADIRGNGLASTAPVIDLSPTAMDFGSVSVNQVITLPLNVRNAGAGRLTIQSLVSSNPAFLILSPATPVDVATGQTQVVSLRFAPSATGPANGTLTIESNDPNRPRIAVNLSGVGLASAPAGVPRISSLVPASLVAGALRFNLTVIGSGFTTASQVLWNGSPRPTAFVDSARITASIAPEDVASPGEAVVTVSTSGGGTSLPQPVLVSGRDGHTARITSFELDSCPTVKAIVTASDRQGLPVTSLSPINLRCTEDGRPDAIPCSANAAPRVGSGLSTLIVLHASAGRPPNNFSETAAQRLNALSYIEGMAPSDRLFLTVMDNGVRPLSREFTIGENRDALRDAVDDFVRAAAQPLGTGTSLFDAIEDGLQRLSRETGRRRAMIVFTSSQNTYDTNGPRDRNAINAFFARIQTSGVPIYLFPIGEGYDNIDLLNVANQLALDSAGELYRDRTIEVDQQIRRLAAALSNQQVVNYNTASRDGLPHLLRIAISLPGGANFSTARAYPGCR